MPSRRWASMSSPLPDETEKLSRGLARRSSFAARATNRNAGVSPAPMDIVPESSSESPDLISASMRSARSTRSSARRLRAMPFSVSSIPRAPRSNSFWPSSSSNAASCVESAGCDTCSRSEARVMFPSSATARKYLSIRMSMPHIIPNLS